VVCGWNPTTQTFNKTFIVGLSPTLFDFAILPSTGYWIYSAADNMLNLSGALAARPQTREVALPTGGGWATLGFNSLNESWHANDIPSMYSAVGGVKMVVAWDQVAKAYKSWLSITPLVNNFLLVPGQAFWVYCIASGTFSYSP